MKKLTRSNRAIQKFSIQRKLCSFPEISIDSWVFPLYSSSWISSPIHLSQGAQYLVRRCKARWIFTCIACAQFHPKIRLNSRLRKHQSWKIKYYKGRLVVSCRVGKRNLTFAKKMDKPFPLDRLEIMVVRMPQGKAGQDLYVALLPSESYGIFMYEPTSVRSLLYPARVNRIPHVLCVGMAALLIFLHGCY